MKRRHALKSLGMAGGLIYLSPQSVFADNIKENPYSHPYFSWINQTGGPRPEFAWINSEDIVYHESYIRKEWQLAPEFYAILEQIHTFNRAMKWHRDRDNIIAFEETGKLVLTGNNRVSDWFSDPANVLKHTDSGNVSFQKKSTFRNRDCVVLPTFQFNIHQHPTLTIEVAEADTDWQCCISVKGRSGPPLLHSGWQKGAKTFTLDIKKALSAKGYALNYAELHIVMGVWTEIPEKPGSIIFKAFMEGRAAVVPCLPVICSSESVKSPGIYLTAVALDAEGRRVSKEKTGMTAFIEGKPYPMVEKDFTWSVLVPALPEGNYLVTFRAAGAVKATATQMLRVTDGHYFNYEKEKNLVSQNNRLKPALTGSYQGGFYFKHIDKGGPEEMVNGQQAYDQWSGEEKRLHYWEALTEKELDQRFAYLQECGWDLLHLCQHWCVWKKLDAGGNISPHGAEQLALFLRTAHKYQLSLVQALTHYQYALKTDHSGWGTPPYRQYVEAGFTDEEWFKPEPNSKFQQMFHRYLADYALLFKEETALAALSASGEGDHKTGLARCIDIRAAYTAIDKNHIFIGEPIHIYRELPEKQSAGWDFTLIGSRTYSLGDSVEEDIDMGIYFKLNKMRSNIFMAEGSFPAPELYSKLMFLPSDERYQSWIGTEYYRTNVRDSLYLGLVNRMPIMLTWEEQLTEDEHIFVRKIREMIDWKVAVQAPSFALLIDDKNIKENKNILARYERLFTSRYVFQYKYISEVSQANGLPVIDARTRFDTNIWDSEGGVLPNQLIREQIFTIDSGHTCSFQTAADRSFTLAYLPAISRYTNRKVLYSKIHRTPVPVPLELVFNNTKGNYLLIDLNAKMVVKEGIANQGDRLTRPPSKSDYFLLVK